MTIKGVEFTYDAEPVAFRADDDQRRYEFGWTSIFAIARDTDASKLDINVTFALERRYEDEEDGRVDGQWLHEYIATRSLDTLDTEMESALLGDSYSTPAMTETEARQAIDATRSALETCKDVYGLSTESHSFIEHSGADR